ncbi:MAG: hypothetical protein ACRCVA_14495 [Phreatobacter sp.]
MQVVMELIVQVLLNLVAEVRYFWTSLALALVVGVGLGFFLGPTTGLVAGFITFVVSLIGRNLLARSRS